MAFRPWERRPQSPSRRQHTWTTTKSTITTCGRHGMWNAVQHDRCCGFMVILIESSQDLEAYQRDIHAIAASHRRTKELRLGDAGRRRHVCDRGASERLFAVAATRSW